MFNLFKPRPKRWITPAGNVWALYNDMSRQTHLLIAGSTGSGKSCASAGIIATLLTEKAPSECQFVFIDPKMTELSQYKALPHTLIYAFEHDDIVKALQSVVVIMENRLHEMQRRGEKQYSGPHIYVIIDELADIMITLKKQAKQLLQRILQLARAANIHVIACTQVTLASVIPTEIKINFPGIVALKVPTAANSRLMIDRAGCELFPDPAIEHTALCYYKHGCQCELYKLPYVGENELTELVNYWTDKTRCIR